MIVRYPSVSQPLIVSFFQVKITLDDVNDAVPTFIPPLTIHINEASLTDVVVAKLLATDQDLGDNGNLTFSLLSQTQLFFVDPQTGDIKVCRGGAVAR